MAMMDDMDMDAMRARYDDLHAREGNLSENEGVELDRLRPYFE